MTLGFCIPTWNRADKLKVCLESICSQSVDKPVKVYVFDNGSTDDTQKTVLDLQKKYANIIYGRSEIHYGYDVSFRTSFNMSETQWTWTMGDDDILMQGVIDFILPRLNDDIAFYKVSEVSRHKTDSIYMGTFLDLCNNYGFTDICGFISGNLVQTKYMKEALKSKNWDIYAKSSFVHSLALLEVLHDKESALVDIPMVNVQPFESNQDTVDRWKDENICYRYKNISYGLVAMREQGILPEKLTEDFFRYSVIGLFQRICNDFVVMSIDPKETIVSEEDWQCLIDMASFIPDERGMEVMRWLINCKHECMSGVDLMKKAIEKSNKMATALSSLSLPQYTESYVG